MQIVFLFLLFFILFNMNDLHNLMLGCNCSSFSDKVRPLEGTSSLQKHSGDHLPIKLAIRMLLIKTNDFLAMKGTKLPQRPKKRAKNIEKTSVLIPKVVAL